MKHVLSSQQKRSWTLFVEPIVPQRLRCKKVSLRTSANRNGTDENGSTTQVASLMCNRPKIGQRNQATISLWIQQSGQFAVGQMSLCYGASDAG